MQYQVQFSKPASTVYTTQDAIGSDSDDSDVNAAGLSQIVTLASGENNPTIDAGIYTPAAIGDRVWEDTDGNGRQNGTEPGISGVTVRLYNCVTNALVASTTTGANGIYNFAGLPPGTYHVEFQTPAGFVRTIANVGFNGFDNDDSDAATANGTNTGFITGCYTLNSGDNNTTVDGGFVRPASLGDRLWVDANGNGLQDGGEAGVVGQAITLIGGGADGLISTPGDNTSTNTLTGADGLYGFTGLTPGVQYQVQFSKPAGTAFTVPDVGANGSDTTDSDANPVDGKTQVVTLASGENNLTLDAGVVMLPSTGGLRLVKSTNAVNPANPTLAEDANTAPGLGLPVGTQVVWTYQVFNESNTALQITSLMDDAGTPQTPGDDFNPVPVLAAGFNVGDTDTDNLLDTNEVWLYTSSGVAGAAYQAQLGLTQLAPSLTFNFTQANSYALLGLNGGNVSVNSATAVTGDFGYSRNSTSTTNQKIGEDFFGQWKGTAYVHSAVGTFQYTDKNYIPNGGIVTSPAQDARLDTANAEALAASAQLAALTTTINAGAINDTSATWGVVNGVANLNVVQVNSLNMNSDVLELRGDEQDYFVINVLGNFDFSQSEVRLTGGLTANHVIFNFPTAGTQTRDVLLNKASTIFNGTILAPDLDGFAVEYHNPASFTGAIIAKNITVHSDFNLNHAPFYPQYTNLGTVTGKIPNTNTTYTDTDPSNHYGFVAASLGDRLWNDTNANGIQDSGEAGISGQTITLIGGGGDGLISTAGDNTSTTTVTGANGIYGFAGLTPGMQYQVQFSKPVGSVYTSKDIGADATDSDADTTTGRSQIVTLVSGENNTTIDAGVVGPPASITLTKTVSVIEDCPTGPIGAVDNDRNGAVDGGINLGNLTKYLFVFTNGSVDANWQGATKGFAGDVAIDGIQAAERTSGGVPFAGTIYTNDTTLGAWGGIVSQNAGQAVAATGQTALIAGLETDLSNAFAQINGLAATTGYTSVSSTSLNGLNTLDGVNRTYVINVTSGFQVSSQINITGDAGDVFVMRWDTDTNAANGYQGEVKFQSGGAIVPKGGLTAGNFIHVAGDINSSGGGNTPPAPFPQGPRLDDGAGALPTGASNFSGGGFFTGYWLTTGSPTNGETGSLSNGIFVGGWYSSTTKFSMTSGTSGVYVCVNDATQNQIFNPAAVGTDVAMAQVGDQLVYTYSVKNNGAAALSAPTVTDDNGTVGNLADDFTAPAVLSNGKNYGDTNGNNSFDSGETWYFQKSVAATAPGVITNLATATVPGATSTDTATVSVIRPVATSKFFVVDSGTDKYHGYDKFGATEGQQSLAAANTESRGITGDTAGTMLWVLDRSKSVFVASASGVSAGAWTATDLSTSPEGIAKDGNDLWMVDSASKLVYWYKGAALNTSGTDTAEKTVALATAVVPKGLTTDGTTLWVVSDSSANTVFRYTIVKDGLGNVTGLTAAGSWTLDSRNTTPTGITLDPTGASQSLWVVDSGTDTVYEYASALARTSGSNVAAVNTFKLTAANTLPQDIFDPMIGGMASDAEVGSTSMTLVEMMGPSAQGRELPSLSDLLGGDTLDGALGVELGGMASDMSLREHGNSPAAEMGELLRRLTSMHRDDHMAAAV